MPRLVQLKRGIRQGISKMPALFSVFAAGLLGWGTVGVGNAKAVDPLPLKIESENIMLYGDVRPDLAMERVQQWETYRKMVYALSGIANPPADPNRLTIFAFNRVSDLQDFTDNRGIGGVYTQGIDGPIFLTSLNQNYNEGDYSSQTGFHEYTHHILNAVVREGFPRWYDEGFANYLATMQIDGDTVTVGDPSAAHLVRMKEGRADFIDPETVLNAISFYPSMSRREARKGGMTSFYGQSTLYVHYLLSNPEYRTKLPEYLKLISTPGVDPLDAFEDAYGISIDDFHSDARQYYRKDEYVVTVYQPGPDIMEADAKIERISEETLARMQIPARLEFLTDGNASDFNRELMKAYQEDPGNTLTTAGLVTIDVQAERYDDAVSRAEDTLAANPTDRYALLAAAGARMMRVTAPHNEEHDDDFAPYPMHEDLKVAAQRYETVFEEDPLDYYAVRSLASMYGMSDMPVPEAAFNAARVLDLRYMDNFNPFWGLQIATIYAKKGFELDACDFYQKAVDSTSDFKDRELGSFKGYLEWFGENYGQSCQLSED